MKKAFAFLTVPLPGTLLPQGLWSYSFFRPESCCSRIHKSPPWPHWCLCRIKEVLSDHPISTFSTVSPYLVFLHCSSTSLPIKYLSANVELKLSESRNWKCFIHSCGPSTEYSSWLVLEKHFFWMTDLQNPPASYVSLSHMVQFSCVWDVITWSFFALVKYLNIWYSLCLSLCFSYTPFLLTPTHAQTQPPIKYFCIMPSWIYSRFIGCSRCVRHKARCWGFNGKARKKTQLLPPRKLWSNWRSQELIFKNSPIDGNCHLVGADRRGVHSECCSWGISWSRLRDDSHEDRMGFFHGDEGLKGVKKDKRPVWLKK